MSKSDSEQYIPPYTGRKESYLYYDASGEAFPEAMNLIDTDFNKLSIEEEDEPNPTSESEDDFLTDDKKKYTPEACLFVASLVSSHTEKQLQDSVVEHFKKWGPLENVKVLKDSMNRPYSFVQYQDVASAERALEEAHNTIVDGRHIRVEKARVNRKLFITRISPSLSEQGLEENLLSHGPLESFRMIRNATTGDNKGSCFVQYKYREDAIKAFMYFKNQGRWDVEWASTQEKVPRSYDFNSIFVGQLSPGKITRESLESRFAEYGTIDNINLINKPSSDNAFAFIKYQSQEACVRAIEGEDGIFWHDRPMRVQFKESPQARSFKGRRSPRSGFPNGFRNDNVRYHNNSTGYQMYNYPQPYFSDPRRPPNYPDNQFKNMDPGKIPPWVAQYPMITQNPDGSYCQTNGYYFIGHQGYPGGMIPSPRSVYSRSASLPGNAPLYQPSKEHLPKPE